jgi:3-methylcrotonyl-CoA carboxylase alpha subunit
VSEIAIRPIRTLLIANRGEIAVRIIRTTRRLGIRIVAVYSEADRDALHVTLADEARAIGPAPARQSYLSIPAILEAANKSGADAIHPGYGFLSENADFADACAAAGIVFVGPPASAIRAMGSKSAAKALMEKAGVPLVPGYHGDVQTPERLRAEAERIGFPVLIKASAGGGGKGMKAVREAAEFDAALASAKREALSAFGDDTVLIERYLTRPRHIEMQVFGDRRGGTVHLFERDCSIQRRHQKVVEEAPAPGMSPERRKAMGEAAVAAAKAVGYVGAGTVEFIAEGDDFYFMEMNTRLQVEHPVTEAITGQDLVEWQIRVAEGHPLPLAQKDITAGGHAVEVRLYAEDPERDFLPQTGRLQHLAMPEGLAGVRVDTGVVAGDAIGVHYDPMIAKIIAHGSDRAEAARRLSAALAATEVVGLATNRRFLKAIVDHPAFLAGDLDTGFIGRHEADLFGQRNGAGQRAIVLAALARLKRAEAERRAAADAADPFSPWDGASGWRATGDGRTVYRFEMGGETVDVAIRHGRDGLAVELPDATVPASGTLDADGRIAATIDGVRVTGRAIFAADAVTVFLAGEEYRLDTIDPLTPSSGRGGSAGHLMAPMPGTVIAVSVAAGDAVKKGAHLVVVEAMKMEHTIAAPRDGIIAKVAVAVGDLVAEGAELVALEEKA